MKRLGLALTLCCIIKSASGAVGCMDNSYRLTEHNDTKEYHYVTCDCPCEKKYAILERKSTCSKCGHYRDPRYSAMLIKHGPVSCPKAFTDFACAKRAACTKHCTQ